MGKGSTPRPLSISKREFDRRWERTFQKKSGPPRPRLQVYTKNGVHKAERNFL